MLTNLLSNNWQNFELNSVELVKTRPGSGRRQTFEELQQRTLRDVSAVGYWRCIASSHCDDHCAGGDYDDDDDDMDSHNNELMLLYINRH